MGDIHEVLERGVYRHFVLIYLLFCQVFRLTEGLGVEDGAGA